VEQCVEAFLAAQLNWRVRGVLSRFQQWNWEHRFGDAVKHSGGARSFLIDLEYIFATKHTWTDVLLSLPGEQDVEPRGNRTVLLHIGQRLLLNDPRGGGHRLERLHESGPGRADPA
jgi:hypothetical protein